MSSSKPFTFLTSRREHTAPSQRSSSRALSPWPRCPSTARRSLPHRSAQIRSRASHCSVATRRGHRFQSKSAPAFLRRATTSTAALGSPSMAATSPRFSATKTTPTSSKRFPSADSSTPIRWCASAPWIPRPRFAKAQAPTSDTARRPKRRWSRGAKTLAGSRGCGALTSTPRVQPNALV